MVPVGSSVMLELVLAVHSYHVIAYLGYVNEKQELITRDVLLAKILLTQ